MPKNYIPTSKNYLTFGNSKMVKHLSTADRYNWTSKNALVASNPKTYMVVTQKGSENAENVMGGGEKSNLGKIQFVENSRKPGTSGSRAHSRYFFPKIACIATPGSGVFL